jgi:protoporphyrinogen oxidase
VTGGIEALVRAIAAPIQDKIRCGFSVSSIKKTEDGFSISNGTETILAERCISTIPPQELLPCLSDVPSKVIEAIAALHYNSLFSVCLGVSHPVNDYSWLYVPQDDLGMFNRVSFPSNYSDVVAPAGQSSVLAEITFNDGDEVSRMTNDAIISHTVAGLVRMNILESPEDVVYATVRRQDYAYVVYDLAYQKNISVILSYLRERGIEPLGRFGEFEYLNMDGCIRRVLDYLGLKNPV